ncbi:ABC transporter substrate-binding protein [Corynebacterium aquatimens]|uniref:Peptide/nickel transport system substrate-binding protein n=1 Tax=Corynebacterium aquatimens TaxID=1190508 RepID=A0A931E149_9CORY|nr:ABC transporter substrate-binding protein [Corynebacterium aquatimens]MBG6121720.1 peptide/nickel transport system substrate-binding protein [Corynebacterium aquatimens]WJY65741.1 Bacterial extracellular solute-binding protein, family 5 [Corynebacterium aquatimens]
MKPLKAAAAALTAVALSLGTVACSGNGDGADENPSTDYFGYQLPVPLVTSNAATNLGDSLKMQRLSGRVFPGPFVPGPSGQMIPNTDLVTTQVLPGANRKVEYTLTEQAKFSDGVPVTCDDYQLAFTAGKNPAIFSSHMPQFDAVESIECTPGSKKFTIKYVEKAGGRWRELFGAGTVLPAHAIAKKIGLETAALTGALQASDYEVMARAADVWRFGYALDKFDPALQVSFGPYKIQAVGKDGEVTLVANDAYYGQAPQIDTIVVWPGSADTADLVSKGALKVGDISDPKPAWFDPNAEGNPYKVETVVGEMTDTLVFADGGAWADKEMRAAVSKCIDPKAVAAASSKVAGVEVPVTPVRVLPHNDPLARRLGDIANPHLNVDIEGARAAAGTELRVGYSVADPRYAAMVEAMRVSCEPAGISIKDVTGKGKTRGDLVSPDVLDEVMGTVTPGTGSIDAYLGAVAPMREYDSSDSRSGELRALRGEERRLWDELPSIPLSAQPRTFVIDKSMEQVVPYTGPVGIGWNMDRWRFAAAAPSSAQKPKKTKD